MLNPVVIPVPLALAFIVAFAAAVYAADRFLRAEAWDPWAETATETPAPATRGRHRPESIAAPVTLADIRSRPRRILPVEMAARIEEVREQDGNSMWSWSPPLEIAGLPDREPVEPGPLHIAEDVHPAPCGFPDVVPCICTAIVEDTRELETVH